jgi:serine/threonine protein kinase
MISIIEKYKQLDPQCRKQCKILIKHLERDPKVISMVRELKPQNDKEKIYAQCLGIKSIPILKLLENRKLYKYLFCYNTKEESPHGNFYMIDQITSGDHVCLLSGWISFVDVKVPIVCKYYKSIKRTIEHEVSCYRKLRAMGCEIPWMSSSYKLLGESVLLVERLHTIDSTDIPENIGIDVLKQLQHLHTFGVHCDLKPGNIMVRRRDYECYVDDPKTCCKYVIIDHGGTAIEKLENGYRRFTWNPKFTSQEKGIKNQIATPINDFIELGYTMCFLDNNKNNTMKKFDHRKDFNGKIKKYMDIVLALDHKNIPDDIYSNLIKVLQ